MRAEPGRGYERLVELIIGAKIAAALHVVVDKGLADVLARGPQTAEALAQAVKVPVETLRRFLRALTQVGLFAEVKDGVFANTEVSEHLRSDAPYSLRDMVTVLDDEAVARGWRRLPDVLASGQPAFDAAEAIGELDHAQRPGLVYDQRKAADRRVDDLLRQRGGRGSSVHRGR